MRDESIDEFKAVFEHASIPVLEIGKVSFRHVAVVLRDHSLDNSALDIGAYLKGRFGAKVSVFWPEGMEEESARSAAAAHDGELAPRAYAAEADLVGQVSIARPELLVFPVPEGASRIDVDVDTLVENTAPPVLIARKPVNNVREAFARLLHSLSGNFQQTRNFEHPFSLVEGGGAIRLLHVVESGEVDDVRAALQAAPHVTSRAGTEVLAAISHHGERFLRAVVASMRDEHLEVSYQLAVGDVVDIVLKELDSGHYGLLVVGHHEAGGRSRVTAADYRLMHQVKRVPVLAL